MDAETKLLVKDVAEEAATEAVQRTLLTLGVDVTDPIEAQKDMSALRELRALVEDEDFRKDLAHLRRWRLHMNSIESKGLLAALGLFVMGFIAFMWYGMKTKLFGTM